MTDSEISWDNRLVDKGIFMKLKSKIFKKDLEALCEGLGLEEGILEGLRSDHGQLEEIVFNLLRRWKQSKGKDATNGALCKALAYANRPDLVLLWKRNFSDLQGSGDSTTIPPGDVQMEVQEDKLAVVATGATMTANNDLCYKISGKPRGKCLILTYDTFRDSEGKVKEEDSRGGNLADVANLKRVFGHEVLLFEVEDHLNLNFKQTDDKIKDMSQKYHYGDCFVLVVCSHGDEEGFLTSDDKNFKIQDVLTYFNAENCKSLAEKPKIFFFINCRGGAHQQAMQVDNVSNKRGVGAMTSFYRPNEADFCVILSTVPGYVNFRDPQEGTYFVQSLCRCLESNYMKLDLIRILTITNDDLIKVFNERIKATGGKDKRCQVATIIMTLAKLVYFVT